MTTTNRLRYLAGLPLVESAETQVGLTDLSTKDLNKAAENGGLLDGSENFGDSKFIKTSTSKKYGPQAMYYIVFHDENENNWQVGEQYVWVKDGKLIGDYAGTTPVDDEFDTKEEANKFLKTLRK